MSRRNRLGTKVAGQLAQAAAAAPALPVRRALTTLASFPSEFGRANLRGTKRNLDKVSSAQLGDTVKRVLTDSPRVQLVHAGNLMMSDEVLDLETDFYGELAELLLARSLQVWPNSIRGRDMVIGKLSGASKDFTLEERAMRVAKALMTMAAEMRAHSYDPRMLLDPRWHDQAIRFVRAYVMRAGFEHGIRFEFRNMLWLETGLRTDAREFRFQRLVPNVAGKQVTHGMDAFMHVGGLAYPFEFKAVTSLASLFSGTVSFTRKKKKGGGGLITAVNGPDLSAQIVAGLLRCQHWSRRIPKPSNDWRGVAPPSVDYDELAPTSLALIDDIYLINQLMAHISLALERSGGGRQLAGQHVLDFGAIHRDVRGDIRTLFQDFVQTIGGDEVLVVDDAEAMWDLALTRFHGRLIVYYTRLNELLETADIVAAVGHRQEAVLLAPSEDPSAVLEVLGLLP